MAPTAQPLNHIPHYTTHYTPSHNQATTTLHMSAAQQRQHSSAADARKHTSNTTNAQPAARKRGDTSPEAEHLGWRATSSMPSKKRKYIEGVSGKGVVELQAQLYRTQEQARLRGDGLAGGLQDKHTRRQAGIDVASIKNKGVEEREARDRAQQQRSVGSGPERLAESAAALQRKAALYDRLAAQGGGDEDENGDDRYEVEFWRKGPSYQDEEQQQHQHQHQQRRDHHQQQRWDYDEHEWLEHEHGSSKGQQHPYDSVQEAVDGSGDMMTQDMARELERREWEAREETRLAAEAAEASRREAHKAAIRELSAQTQAGRDEAAVARAAKDEAQAAKRERLKAAFLAQQLQALKKAGAAAGSSSKKAAGVGAGSSKSSSKKSSGRT